MPAANPRFLYVRLPDSLLNSLEEARFHTSQRVGRRVPLRALVQTALQHYLAELQTNPASLRDLDACLTTDTDVSVDADEQPSPDTV